LDVSLQFGHSRYLPVSLSWATVLLRGVAPTGAPSAHPADEPADPRNAYQPSVQAPRRRGVHSVEFGASLLQSVKRSPHACAVSSQEVQHAGLEAAPLFLAGHPLPPELQFREPI